MHQTSAVRLTHVTKRFGRLVAVNDVSLAFSAGEIIGIIGGNGSGKSTLMNVLAGMFPPDDGQVFLNGQEIRFQHPSDALRRGIVMLPQSPQLYSGLDIVENIFAGQERTLGASQFGILDRRAMRRDAVSLLAQTGASSLSLEQPAGTLSGGQQKAVAIATLLARNASVLIFDEPTAALAQSLRANTLRMMQNMRNAGKTVVLITHDLSELEAVCNRVVVMRQGSVMQDRPLRELGREQLTQFLSQE